MGCAPSNDGHNYTSIDHDKLWTVPDLLSIAGQLAEAARKLCETDDLSVAQIITYRRWLKGQLAVWDAALKGRKS